MPCASNLEEWCMAATTFKCASCMCANSTRQPSLELEALDVAATLLEHEHPTDVITLLAIVHSITGGLSEDFFKRLD